MLEFYGEFPTVHPIAKLCRFLVKKLQKISSEIFHRKLENLKKFPKMLGFNDEFQALHAKAKFRYFLVKNCNK